MANVLGTNKRAQILSMLVEGMSMRSVARLTAPLSKSDFILGDEFSAADLLLASPYVWMPDATPDVPVIRDWVARCQARPSARRLVEFDKAHASA